MKKDYTDITLILDRSGSMRSVKDDTIGGVNQYVESQKNGPGECRFSLIQFDDRYEVVYDGKLINEVEPLTEDTFVPRGYTRLLDAIGKTVNDTGRRLASMSEGNRPDKVIIVIVTDGNENYSKEFSWEQIRNIVDHQKVTYNWEFVFVGANQDAILSGNQLGIGRDRSLNYTANSIGTQSLYKSLATNTLEVRCGVKSDMSWTTNDIRAQSNASA
jgi:hypothetical protein